MGHHLGFGSWHCGLVKDHTYAASVKYRVRYNIIIRGGHTFTYELSHTTRSLSTSLAVHILSPSPVMQNQPYQITDSGSIHSWSSAPLRSLLNMLKDLVSQLNNGIVSIICLFIGAPSTISGTGKQISVLIYVYIIGLNKLMVKMHMHMADSHSGYTVSCVVASTPCSFLYWTVGLAREGKLYMWDAICICVWH